ncbi:MAG: glycosyltransferase [Patescibacteria group bacterium]|jgi:glycosyltransferase involved in cell wall biosynthesis
MKVVHLNYSDGQAGGGAVSSVLLHKNLIRKGASSVMIVRNHFRGVESSIRYPSKWALYPRLLAKVRAINNKFLETNYHLLPDSFYHTNFSPTMIARAIDRLNPNIVHLHVFPDLISIREISQLNMPIVITLRDYWPMTGGCHFPFDCQGYQKTCGQCPVLHSTDPNDLSHKVWQQKEILWSDRNISVVAPSSWMKECAERSSLFGNKQIHLIPNGIDTTIFKPHDKQRTRNHFGLSKNKKIVLCGSHDLQHQHKGIVPLLSLLDREINENNVQVVAFGTNPPKMDRSKFKFIGSITDRAEMAKIFSAADVFVCPTRTESFGLVIAESMACGTPVVAFGVGGPLDIIDHRQNGYLAAPQNFEDIYKGIQWVIDETKKTSFSGRCREKIVSNFDITNIAKQYLDLYQTLVH